MENTFTELNNEELLEIDGGGVLSYIIKWVLNYAISKGLDTIVYNIQHNNYNAASYTRLFNDLHSNSFSPY